MKTFADNKGPEGCFSAGLTMLPVSVSSGLFKMTHIHRALLFMVSEWGV